MKANFPLGSEFFFPVINQRMKLNDWCELQGGHGGEGNGEKYTGKVLEATAYLHPKTSVRLKL